MDTANPQGGGRRTRKVPSERLRQEEDALLIAMRYKPVAGGDRLLWVKGDGVYYGRQAALQVEKRKQREADA